MRRDLLKINEFYSKNYKKEKTKLQANSCYSTFPQVWHGFVDSVARKVEYIAVEIIQVDSK